MQGVEINTIYVFNVDLAQVRLAYRSDLPGQKIFNVIYIYIYIHVYIHIYIETIFKIQNENKKWRAKLTLQANAKRPSWASKRCKRQRRLHGL